MQCDEVHLQQQLLPFCSLVQEKLLLSNDCLEVAANNHLMIVWLKIQETSI